MLTKSQIKLITQLKQKKFREQHQLFVAEGIKTISELLHSSYELFHLYSVNTAFDVSQDVSTTITPNELKKISFLKSPKDAVALFKVPGAQTIDTTQLIVALDNVRDPGNLGTIIRLCDWFGIKDLVCNHETADCYNPKVIQATMGSIARVNVHYLDLALWLSNQKVTSYGAYMDGDSVYESQIKIPSVVILGNEANGISPKTGEYITKRLSIPQFGSNQDTESLNVANAAAILLSEFRRQTS